VVVIVRILVSERKHLLIVLHGFGIFSTPVVVPPTFGQMINWVNYVVVVCIFAASLKSTVSAKAVRGWFTSSTKIRPGLLPSIAAWMERL
jgi:hypothetical protein